MRRLLCNEDPELGREGQGVEGSDGTGSALLQRAYPTIPCAQVVYTVGLAVNPINPKPVEVVPLSVLWAEASKSYKP